MAGRCCPEGVAAIQTTERTDAQGHITNLGRSESLHSREEKQ